MGKAQKLKQQRKMEEERKKREERAKTWRTVIIVIASIATIAVTVGLIFLVNYLKEKEAEEPAAGDYQQQLEEAQALDASVPNVPDEIGVSNLRGGVAMAKPSDPETQEPLPDSAQNEFYILKQDSTFLDPYFTVFGQVTEGMDIVDALTTEDYLMASEVREVEGDEPAREWILNTSKGTIVVRLLTQEAPLTTQHIIDLTGQGFYNDLKWYRVEDFVVQTGSHARSLSTQPVSEIPVEEGTTDGDL